MWLSPKNTIKNTTQTSPNGRSTFNRHSFKNIEDLLDEEDDPKNVSTTNTNKYPVHNTNDQQNKQKQKRVVSSPMSLTHVRATRQSVFHRVCLANHVTRSLTPVRPKPVHEKSQPVLKRNEKSSPRRNEKSSPKFSPRRNEKSSARQKSDSSTPTIKIPDSENRIIVYTTSLRVVRSTFEACRTIRSILQGFLVQVDERDLSMDSSFKDELIKIMSQENKYQQKTKFVDLPKVFIGGRYVGDAEDLRQLNETGELKKLIERLPPVSRSVCEECGDFRFVICTDCYGSRKCYKDKGGFRSCTACNRNGLIKCSTCWTVK